MTRAILWPNFLVLINALQYRRQHDDDGAVYLYGQGNEDKTPAHGDDAVKRGRGRVGFQFHIVAPREITTNIHNQSMTPKKPRVSPYELLAIIYF